SRRLVEILKRQMWRMHQQLEAAIAEIRKPPHTIDCRCRPRISVGGDAECRHVLIDSPLKIAAVSYSPFACDLSTSDPAEHKRRPKRDARAWVGAFHDRGHVVAAGVEARQNAAILAQDSR